MPHPVLYRQEASISKARSEASSPFKRPVRAVLLDVDGTLYHQAGLRLLMALELSALPFVEMSCRSSSRIWRSLRYFRRVREELRSLGKPEAYLAQLQYVEAARRSGSEPADMRRVVSEWIHRRPLKYLKICRRRGIEGFLSFLENRSIQVGAFSDYPVVDKLATLRLSDRISLRLCATDPEINAFKPHPAGFLRACAIWGLSPEEVLYVGDRPEVDAVGAAMAGMSCAIFCRSAVGSVHGDYSRSYLSCSSFLELQHILTTVS